jgi:hypothetical protein
MTLPAQLNVSLNFNSGATFGNPFTIGDPVNGKLGFGILGDGTAPALVIDVTSVTRSINIKRGRNILRDTYEAGSATVRIYDQDGRFNPQNTSSDLFGQLTPLRKLRISASYLGTSYYLFSGYTTTYTYTYDQAEQVSYVDITAVDGFRLFNLANITTVTGQANGDDTGERIGKILDTVSFPNSMRTIDVGDSLCQSDPGSTRTALNAIVNAEFSEQGAFYMDSEGQAVFKNRTAVVASAGGTPIEFNQTGDIPYKNLAFAFDDKLIINQATITRIGGTAQFAEDTGSVATYFPHSVNYNDLVVQTDTDANNIARIYVATRSDTTIRIDAMTLDLLDPAVPTGTVLGMDYFTNVDISNIQPDGSTITKNLQVQGISWDITPNRWLGTFTTLEPITDGFIIGNNTYGVLGDDILGY